MSRPHEFQFDGPTSTVVNTEPGDNGTSIAYTEAFDVSINSLEVGVTGIHIDLFTVAGDGKLNLSSSGNKIVNAVALFSHDAQANPSDDEGPLVPEPASIVVWSPDVYAWYNCIFPTPFCGIERWMGDRKIAVWRVFLLSAKGLQAQYCISRVYRTISEFAWLHYGLSVGHSRKSEGRQDRGPMASASKPATSQLTSEIPRKVTGGALKKRSVPQLVPDDRTRQTVKRPSRSSHSARRTEPRR